MDLDYSTIINSRYYAKYKKLMYTSGNQKLKFVFIFFGSIILVFAAMALVPVLIPVVIFVVFTVIGVGLYKLIKQGSKDWQLIQQTLSEFARQNSFSYQQAPFAQVTGNDIPDINLTLPFKATLQTNSGYMRGIYKNLPFDYISGDLLLVDYRGISAQSGGQETRSLTALSITLPITSKGFHIADS